jgi:hypothetical protein
LWCGAAQPFMSVFAWVKLAQGAVWGRQNNALWVWRG